MNTHPKALSKNRYIFGQHDQETHAGQATKIVATGPLARGIPQIGVCARV
ncbi:MAG: hypothetical protein ACE368_22925 [Paracoccaceae bacterium]